MAKKEKPKKKRASKYEAKLKLNGSLDEILKVTIAAAKKPEKKKK